MSDKILDESIIEETEPMTPDELIAHLVQDITADNSPELLASEFINGFVLEAREETAQILSLLEMPSETLIGLLKGIVGQSYQASIDALDTRGVTFLENLKGEIKGRMTRLASDTA